MLELRTPEPCAYSSALLVRRTRPSLVTNRSCPVSGGAINLTSLRRALSSLPWSVLASVADCWIRHTNQAGWDGLPATELPAPQLRPANIPFLSWQLQPVVGTCFPMKKNQVLAS